MNLQENKVIYGKQIRTNNDDFSPIARLWGEVMVEKPTGDIFAVYSNYASDYMGIMIYSLEQPIENKK